MRAQDLAANLAFESTTGLMRELVRGAQEDADPQFLMAQLREGDVLNGKWRLDALIGVGGMAAVYAATHRNGNRVAIKILHSTYACDESARRRFEREGCTANLIQHDGIVRVLDNDQTEDGSVFFVMELLEGETLEAYVRRKRQLSEAESITIASRVLDVLVAAHAHGIVHRDIKPANIFLTQTGEVKILDFGIARLETSASADLTQPGVVLGSPEYIAPEQARGQSKEVDAQTDVWAVGATLFNMLSGSYVHGDGSDREKLIRAGNDPARQLASVRPEVSAELALIVDRALAFGKSERWPDAKAMYEALCVLPSAAGVPQVKAAVSAGLSALEGASQRLALGKYELFATLDGGGMSNVFLGAAHGPMGFKKIAVVKQLRPSLARDDEQVTMFLDEARLAARLSHPNVVQTYEFGEDNGSYFIAMEYLEGCPLSSILREAAQHTTLDVPFIVRIVAGALAGLHYAHELREYDGQPLEIVHRDVSPHNLFVTYAGEAKIVDFGIAKARARATQTSAGVLKGRVTYMAPEQAKGSSVDRRADLFPMGSILWEAVCKQKLIVGASARDKLRRLLNDDFPRASKLVPELDPKLDDIIAKALERDPERRFQTAQEMREALENWLSGTAQYISRDEIGSRLKAAFKDVRQQVEQQIGGYMTNARHVALGQEIVGSKLSAPGSSESGSVPLPALTLHLNHTASVQNRNLEPGARRRNLAVLAALACGTLLVVSLVSRARTEAPSAVSAPTTRAAAPASEPRVESHTLPEQSAITVSAAPVPPAVKNERPLPLRPARSRAAAAAPTASAAPQAETAAPGFLTFDTYPWTMVSENGRALGTTPLIRVPMSPGVHHLTIENPDHALKRTYSVQITSGKVTTQKLRMPTAP